ncbi:hypothetical protein BMF94_2015 [Rhodotorula taiwanensis]|uniref:Uncharacterized protein n=1 Tax=Rhodotorula taiwanensis TaxID=741276 RepID=A0A2S5BE50_9BASI|nr:hypothetical protein BMF94_2015 [Rhodotorula taiwanensis]
MWTRALSRTAATARVRALSTTRSAWQSAVPTTNRDSVKQTQDALYAQQGPSASTPNATEPAGFPYDQPLASERAVPLDPAATSPSPAGTPSQPAPAAAPATAPLRSSSILLDSEPLVQDAPVSRTRRPVGAFRGGIIGFLLGLTAVGGYGYLRVLEDYRQASERLLVSVEELKGSTEQMATHLSRITALESSLEKLTRDAATAREVGSLRDESRKLIESHHLDLLNLKAHVWGIEQDLRNLSRRDTSVRI